MMEGQDFTNVNPLSPISQDEEISQEFKVGCSVATIEGNATATDSGDIRTRESVLFSTGELAENKLIAKSFDILAERGNTLPELKKVWGNHILEGNFVLFPSERGVGKTLLGLQIAMAVANEYPEFLGEKIELHGNTLFINMELGEGIMCRRISRLNQGLSNKSANYSAYCISGQFDLTERMNEIEQLIIQCRPVLIVIDNLRTALSSANNENNAEMTKALMKLNSLKNKYGFSIVLIHHLKKGAGSKLTNSDLQSGAGAISDLVDSDFFLRRNKRNSEERILKRVKSRNAEEQESATLLRLNPSTMWFELVESEVDESEYIYESSGSNERSEQIRQAEHLFSEGKTQTEIAEILGVNKSTVSRWLKGRQPLKTV